MVFLKNMSNSIEFLDCTLRDGGYYNNWNFNNELVNEYLQVVNKIKIKYVELGFRALDNNNKIKGSTAYTTDDFLQSLTDTKEV